jgi:GNAT superfamily N-acetyltransferase
MKSELQISQVDAASLLCGDTPFTFDMDVKENIESLIRSHLKWLDKHYSSSKHKPDPNTHLCLVAVNTGGIVVAYQYFYFEPGKESCELFAIYVASAYRRQGNAKRLLVRAKEVASRAGCNRFVIRLGAPATEEKKGLVEFCRRFADIKVLSSF